MPSTNIEKKREQYIPQDADVLASDTLKTEIYLFEDRSGRPCAKAFKGRKIKPVFHHYFSSEDARAKFIDQRVEAWKAEAAQKAERQAELNKPHELKVDDILYSSWGYEQTNVDFFKVVKLAGKTMIEVTEMACETVKTSGGMSDTVIASKRVLGGILRRKVNTSGSRPSISINSCANAYLWDGSPLHRSWYH